jgi:hypothetical protein
MGVLRAQFGLVGGPHLARTSGLIIRSRKIQAYHSTALWEESDTKVFCGLSVNTELLGSTMERTTTLPVVE